MTSVDISPLRARALDEIRRGLRACQMAVARDGELLWHESFGIATDESRFLAMSATKPLVASAVWHLLAEGVLDLAAPVSRYIPEFGTHGKDVITVEQVLIMTAGVPTASMATADGADARRRAERFSAWTLETPPGTAYQYHVSSAHWVMADLIERRSGLPFCDFIEQRVTHPLGLPRLLGIARSQQTNIVGLGSDIDPTSGLVTDPAEYIAAGGAAGGGVMRARDLALFYQSLLHNPNGLWDADVLRDGTTHVRTTLPDPLMHRPANRTTAVVVGAGFGSTWSSAPRAFGWPGAGGQVGFADPDTGISFAFFQFGSTDPLDAFARASAMSEMALQLGRQWR